MQHSSLECLLLKHQYFATENTQICHAGNRPPTCRLPGKQSFLDARQNTGMVSLYLSFQKYNNNNNNNNSSHEINSGCEINLGLHGKDGTQGDPPCMNHEYYYALQVQV